MDDRLNIALLGTKLMGRAHAHAWRTAGPIFGLDPAPALRIVAARDPDATAGFAASWGVDRWTTDWREAATADDVDVVDVLTPHDLHRDQALAALESGRHVACEKPLAATLEDARAMRDAAADAAGRGVRTFVWYSYRRVPAVALAQRIVASGRLGRLLHVRAAYLQDWGGPEMPRTWRFDVERAGSGAHHDVNAHLIDMARFVTGDEIVEVTGATMPRFVDERPLPSDSGGSGATAPSTVDDAALFLAHTAGGAVASFEASRVATGIKSSQRLEIHGERGALRYEFERMNELQVFDADAPPAEQGWRTIVVTHEDHPWIRHWWPEGHGYGYDHTFVNQAGDIARALAGDEPEAPIPDFADAYETQRVLEAAMIAARERTAIALDDVD